MLPRCSQASSIESNREKRDHQLDAIKLLAKPIWSVPEKSSFTCRGATGWSCSSR